MADGWGAGTVQPWLRVAALLLVVCCFSVSAQPGPVTFPGRDGANAGELRAFLAERRAAMRLPGLAVVVLAEGEIVFEGVFGEAGPGRPLGLDTPFLLGSTSKQFTGLMVQQLVIQGELALDSTVASVLPELGEVDETWSAVSVRQLLAQNSGLSLPSGWESLRLWPRADSLLAEAHRVAQDTSFASQPGTRFEYSNSNYNLLGAIIERVTGQSFADAFQTLIAGPLGLTATTAAFGAAVPDGLAAGHHSWLGRWSVPTPAALSAIGTPAGYFVSNARDLSSYMQAHLDPPAGLEAAIDASKAPLVGIDDHAAYASGWRARPLWELDDWDDVEQEGAGLPTLWEHTGTIPRWMSYLAFAPDLGLAVVVLSNTGQGADQQRWERFSSELLHVVLGTSPKAQAVDPLIAALPPIIVALPMLQLITLLWLRAWRKRAPQRWWLPAVVAGLSAAVGLLFGLVVVPGLSGIPLLDTVWWNELPELTISIGLILVLAVCYLVLVAAGVITTLRGMTSGSAGVRRQP